MCRYHSTEAVELHRSWGAFIDPEDVREAAAKARAGCVYFVHHETTTGRLNDLQSLVSAARADSDRLVLVDAVSSIAGETLEIDSLGLDAVIGSANKCIRGVPGAAFVLASERFVDAAKSQVGPHYTNFARHLELEDVGSTPFTPALQSYFGLQAALEELLEEGVANRVQHFSILASALMEGMSHLGFQTLLEPMAYGHTLLSYKLPEGMSFRQLHRTLRERGFVIYGAQGTLSESTFRLGLIGHFGIDAIRGFLSAIEEIL
jgi:2-aminoethylphosphonate-pyruvate transaminase